MIYDYRSDLINILLKTKDTPESLTQTAISLNIITKSLLADKYDVPGKIIVQIPDETDNKTDSQSKDKPTIETKSELSTDSEKPAKTIKIDKKNIIKKVSTSQDPIQNALLSLNDDEYLIIDRLSGCNATEKNGSAVSYFTERIKRQLGLKQGDIVTLNYNENSNNYHLNCIERHVDLPDKIVLFKYAHIEKDAFGLYIKQNTNHTQFSAINGVKSRYNISLDDIQKFNIQKDDVVDLAWYKDNPGQVVINWKYDLSQSKSTQVGKHSDYVQNTITKALTPQIKFNLQHKTVALVTADDSVAGRLEDLVYLHNGQGSIVEAKNGANVTKRLSPYDIIVLLQNYLSHETSKPILAEFKNKKPIVMSETAGQLNLEKALYRAINNLGVIDQDYIKYPQN